MGKGGIIGKPNNPTVSLASGIWSLQENYSAVKNLVWPPSILFDYSNFASTTGLSLVSTATITSNQIYITNTATNDVGNVYYSTLSRYNRSFSLAWNFECSGGTGADGFCVQWTPTNNTNGTVGGGCGLVLDPSTIHGFIFATYSPGTPGLEWRKNNVAQNSPRAAAAISWRQNVYYWLDYDHDGQTCKIYYTTSTTKPASPSHTFNSFAFDTGTYYVGFGAATGGATDNHILKSMSLTFI